MSTIAQEINAITEAQGGTATGQTIAEAVNALADTLAGEDVAGGRTIAEAVHNIAPYVGGGGGGASVGDLVAVPQITLSVPQVGPKPADFYFGPVPTSMYRLDGKVLLKWPAQTTPPGVDFVAAGIEYCIPTNDAPTPVTAATVDTYKVTYDANINTFTSVTSYDAGIYDEVIDGVPYLVVPMPPLMRDNGEHLITEMLFLVVPE